MKQIYHPFCLCFLTFIRFRYFFKAVRSALNWVLRVPWVQAELLDFFYYFSFTGSILRRFSAVSSYEISKIGNKGNIGRRAKDDRGNISNTDKFRRNSIFCSFYSHFDKRVYNLYLTMAEQQLNLGKLKELIRNGMAAIPKDEEAQEAVIVIGDTGVGKSTILNFLDGRKLMVKVEGLKPKLVCEGPSVIKIGHQKYSETSIPTRAIIQNLAFYDCPGFRDNKGEEYEISNSFFVQRLLDIYDNVKIVLMIDESHISEARADKLPRLTKNLLRSFRSFNEIMEGVILIINRADRELEPSDYCREIKKMSQLKNQRGYLFGQEEQMFLNYLCDNQRIKLFRTPLKKDKGKVFEPTASELNIFPSIKNSDFVKSRHILNIVSESAKIAIRDYIDEMTIKSNVKIERVSAAITEKVNTRLKEAGKQITSLLGIKQDIMNLAEEIKQQEGQNILTIIKRQLPDNEDTDFEDDFESIMFFKGIYDKTDTYFSNLINKTYSELSLVLNKLDAKIIRLQKEEQEELERKQLLLKRKEIQNQRERQKFQTMKQIKQINNLRGQISEMGKSSYTMIKSLGDTLSFLNSLEEQFISLRTDASKLKVVNNELNEQFHNFSSIHLRRQPV